MTFEARLPPGSLTARPWVHIPNPSRKRSVFQPSFLQGRAVKLRWGTPKPIYGVSINGGIPPISHPNGWSFLVGKPNGFVGETHHFRNPPFVVVDPLVSSNDESLPLVDCLQEVELGHWWSSCCHCLSEAVWVPRMVPDMPRWGKPPKMLGFPNNYWIYPTTK